MIPGTTARRLISARGINKRFGARRVLEVLDFSAAAGELVAIQGENGGGKSTLLRILAGFAAPDSGEIWCDGARGFSPQDELLYPHLTAAEHFRLFGKALRLNDQQIGERSSALLDAFAFAVHARRPVHELSGGTRQKLNLALALLGDPPILLLDEPYSGFDAHSYERFWLWLQDARATGKCVVMVSHLVFERKRFDRLLALEGGHLREESA